MGDSAAFTRFVGLRIPQATAEKLNFFEGDGPEEVDGIKFIIHSGPLGEEPYWIIRSDAKSVCQLSESHWDGHGGGGDEFDYHADPFTKDQQEILNQLDTISLKMLAFSLKKHGHEVGPVELVLGWTNTFGDTQWNPSTTKMEPVPDYPKVHESENIVSYGPWRLSGDPFENDEDACTGWWEQHITDPNGTIELPYGKETVPGRPVIPVRTQAESQKLMDEYHDKQVEQVKKDHPHWFNPDGTMKGR